MFDLMTSQRTNNAPIRKLEKQLANDNALNVIRCQDAYFPGVAYSDENLRNVDLPYPSLD